jgi:hypothetical protein
MADLPVRDRIPGEYGLEGDCADAGAPAQPFVEPERCFESSSSYGETRSGLDSAALVAIELNGACRF